MYLPSDEQDWSPVDASEIPEIASSLNSHIHKTRGVKDLLQAAGEGPAGSKLKVSTVARRPLCFYEEAWTLYRFTLDPAESGKPSDDSGRGYLFAARAPQDGPVEDDAWIVLDWTVAAINEINRRAGLKLDAALGTETTTTETNSQAVRDYVRFFVSFLGGERDPDWGLIHPFILPGTFEDLGWRDDLPQTLDAFIKEQELPEYPPLGGINDPDPVDLCDPPRRDEVAAPLAPPEGRVPEAKTQGGAAASREGVEQAFKEFGTQLQELDSDAPPSADEQSEAGSSAAPKAIARFSALIWYQDALYKTEFEVRSDGQVWMLDDEVIDGTDGLPVPHWEVRDQPSPVPLLYRQANLESVSAATLMARIAALAAADEDPTVRQGADAGVRLHRLRVQGPVKLHGAYPAPVRFREVEFLHNVILDEAVFEHSLDFSECRFLGRLSARLATIKGAFRLDKSRFYGTDRDRIEGEGHKAMLDLWGLVAEGGLFADRLLVFGRVRAQHARIGTMLRARGLQIHPRATGGGDPDGDIALDCSHARITGPLDLRAWTPKEAGPGEGPRRTVIGRRLVLRGLSAWEANLDGIWVNAAEQSSPGIAADMTDVRIISAVSAAATTRSGEPQHPAQSERWRARFQGSLCLEHAEAGSACIHGCRITGSLLLQGLRLRGSLFARRDERFRSRIDDVVLLSGAHVDGDIDFSSARIGGEVQYITGRCGRLRAMVEPWPQWQLDAKTNEYRLVPRLCASEASGILLQDLSVEAGVDLAGIQLGKGRREFAEGGLIATGVRVGGGLHFWRKDAEARLLQRIRRDLTYERNWAEIPNDDPAFDNRGKEGIAGVRARLAGTLDVCGIETGGSIDLGRCEVEGKILLDNADVGGNLRAGVDGEPESCTTTALIADNARIKGDADLRGLAIRPAGGKSGAGAAPALLKARDLRVTGKLGLATAELDRAADPQADGAPIARLYGQGSRIELEGTHAAQLTFSGKCIDDAEPRAVARILLGRCRVGQLSVWGFDDDRFPHYVDMTAIEIGDWNGAAAFENVPKLLEATSPFDGRNYVDVEHRLARVGQKGPANAVYRRMAWRAASSWRAKLFYCINWAFSGNGTRAWLMVLWLLLTMLPVIAVLADPRNVEFREVKMDAKHQATYGPYERNDEELVGREWGWIRAVGLALGYAVPLFTAEEADVARARLDGPTCRPAALGDTDAGDGPPPCAPMTCRWLDISPHEFALCAAVMQFMLWIAIGANLPSILRRRQ